MGKNALHLVVNVFSTKVLIGDTTFGAIILRGHPSHAKVSPFAGQRKHPHFSIILRLISQLFYDPEYWSGPRNQTHDLPLCSQALYRLSLSCRGIDIMIVWFVCLFVCLFCFLFNQWTAERIRKNGPSAFSLSSPHTPSRPAFFEGKPRAGA